MYGCQHHPCPEHHPHQCAQSHSLGVVRLDEDSFKYLAKMAAWEAKAGDWRVSPAPRHAVSSTLAPLRPPPLPIANYQLPIPSFVFAATAASEIDVVPHSPAHPAQSSPPLSPIQPRLNKQADAERNAREIIARLLNDYLEAHPEPITGAIDNPFPFADKYGIKGISILSVFFDNLDMDTFTCRFCYDQHESVDDALEHQRTARHYS